VLLWSYFYLDVELSFRTFCALVISFLISISGLVFSGSIVTAFVFWDLLGFTSFFLVVFPRSRASLSGGVLTALSNRCGDVFLLFLFGTFSFSPSSSLSCFSLLVIAASLTKSAQAPFSAWLPAAMVAPTPVSALVHSSTLVTAGVFLVFRFCTGGLSALLYVGGFTTILAGLAACFEVSIKKVVALSTLSQLGLIFVALGLGERSLGFLHLNFHAAFKALLFLAVGTLTHLNYGSQSVILRVNAFIGSGLVGMTFVIRCASLCGLFFLSGWVSKEAILNSSCNCGVTGCISALLWISVLCTVTYTMRLLMPAFMGINNFLAASHTSSLSQVHTLPLLVLCALACVGSLWSRESTLGAYNVLPSLVSANRLTNLGLLLVFTIVLLKFFVPVTYPWESMTYRTQSLASIGSMSSRLLFLEVKGSTGFGSGLIFSSIWAMPFGNHIFGKSFILLRLLLLVY